jgi:phage gp29-like protein
MTVVHLSDIRAQRGDRRPSLTGRQSMVDLAGRHMAGLRFTDPTPAQLAAVLHAKKRGELRDWADLCERMDKSDDHMSGELHTRINRVAQIDWVLNPGPSSSGRKQLAKDAVEFCDYAMSTVLGGDESGEDGCGDPMELDLRGAYKTLLWAIPASAQPLEKMWHRVDGAWLIKHFEFRHLRNFRYGDDFKLRLYEDGLRGAQGEALWSDKWVVHYHTEGVGYPTAAGILEPLVWRWFMRRLAFKWWPSGLEQHGKPWFHGKVPPNTTEAVRQKLLESLQDLSTSGVGITEEDVDIIQRGGEKDGGIGASFKLYEECGDRAISKRILGVSDASGPGENGARSAVDSRIASSMDPRTRNDAHQLSTTIRRDVLRSLCAQNLHLFGGEMPPVPVPVPVFADSGQEVSDRSIAAGAVSINEIREADGYKPSTNARDDRLLYDVRAEEARAAMPAHAMPPAMPSAAPASAPEAAPIAEAQPATDVQQAALNGAQVTSLLEVVARVARGEIPRETGIGIMTAAFPIDEAKAEKLMGTVGAGFVPTVPGDDKPTTQASAVPVGGQGADVPLASQPTGTTTTALAATQPPTPPISSPSTNPIAAALLSGSAARTKPSSVLRRRPPKR